MNSGATSSEKINQLKKETKTNRKTCGVSGRNDQLANVDNTVLEFANEHLDGSSAEKLFWNISSKINLDRNLISPFVGYADLRLLNRFADINTYLERVNRSLEKGQYFITFYESSRDRRRRMDDKYFRPLNYLARGGDALTNRLLPKLSSTREIYFKLKSTPDRILSEAECTGRIAACGFEIIRKRLIRYETVVLVKKVSGPIYDKKPTYGPVEIVSRVGRHKKKLRLRKFRTRYPYSEFLESPDYIKHEEVCADAAKISGTGKWLEKYRLTLLPSLRNVLKGNMKIVGVKPLTKREFRGYPAWLQNERAKHKPGLINPHFADLPKSEIEFFTSEANYLAAHHKSPLLTDLRYLLKSITNILLGRT